MSVADSQSLGEILTVDEVATYLRVSRATICRWCGSGKLPAFKIGKSWRVQKNDLEGYIQQQRIAGSVVRAPESEVSSSL
ncbi:MAG: DNA-binding protein [Spirochaetia bacterium]|nr:DNA-binding protein [Spirochaetia bacterium]